VDAERQLHAIDFRRVDEALHVLTEAENRGALFRVVATDALEYGGAVTHDVRKDMKLGVVPVDEFSVVPDFLCLLNRHDCAPVKSSTRKVRIRQGSGGVNECAGNAPERENQIGWEGSFSVFQQSAV